MADNKQQIDSLGTGLANRKAVVTGALSGIGRAIALRLAEAGADLLVHTRANEEQAEAVRDAIVALGRQASTVRADLAESSGREKLLEAARQWANRVDIWINNAGADVLTGDIASWSFDEKLAYLWRVDVQGTIQLALGGTAHVRGARTRQRFLDHQYGLGPSRIGHGR